MDSWSVAQHLDLIPLLEKGLIHSRWERKLTKVFWFYSHRSNHSFQCFHYYLLSFPIGTHLSQGLSLVVFYFCSFPWWIHQIALFQLLSPNHSNPGLLPQLVLYFVLSTKDLYLDVLLAPQTYHAQNQDSHLHKDLPTHFF